MVNSDLFFKTVASACFCDFCHIHISCHFLVHLMKCLSITLFNSSIVRPIAKFTLMAISISSIDVRPAPAGVIFVCKKTQY